MVGVIMVFCRLALWQYHRAHEREALLTAVRAAAEAPATVLTAAKAHTLPRFARVYMNGRYDDSHQVLLQEMPQPEGPGTGVEVLTPFRLDSGGTVLVNRGWTAADAQGHTQSDLSAPSGSIRITGHLGQLPVPGLRLGRSGSKPGKWPQRLLYPRWESLERLYGNTLVRRVLLLSAASRGGYDRDWRLRPEHGPQENYGYMVQWLGLAGTVFIVWLILTVRAARRVGREGGK